MAFKIVIKADTAQVLPAIDQVGNALGKAEQRAKSTTDALDKGFKTSSASADKAARSFRSVVEELRSASATPFADMFKGLTNEFEREANILERIRGPMREYQADMNSLDAMLKNGRISAHEYNDELTRLIDKQGTMQGPQQQVSAPAPTAGFGAAASFALTGGAIGMALGQVESLITDYQRLQDEYIGLTNGALKFADAGHNVNAIITDQLNLSHELKGGLDATMALYDAVRDGTDEANLSYAEQIRLTKTLGEAVQMANHPLSEAGSIMARFSYAMAAGHIEGRELKSLMVQVPELADIWTKSFNTTRTGLKTMLDTGRIGVGDLVHALIGGNQQIEELDRKFQQRQMTTAQYLDEVAKRAAVIADGMPVGIFDRVAAEAQMATQPILTVSEVVEHLTDKFNTLKKATTNAAEAMQSNLSAALFGAAKAGPGGIGTMEESILAPIMHAREDLVTLEGLFKHGTIDAEQYRKKYDELMTTINDGRLPETIKIWESLREPQQEWSRSIDALNQLLKAGSIDVREYNSELTKLAQAHPMEDTYSKAPPGYVGAGFGGMAAIGYEKPGNFRLDREQSKLDLKSLSPDTNDKQAWDATIDKLMRVQEALSKDRTLTMQWNLELAKLRTSVGDQTWSGFENGMNAINKQIDVSSQATKTLVDGFNSVSDAISDLVTKGTVDWHGMIQSMLADMTKLLLYQGLRSLIGGGGGSAAPGLFGSIPGFASGGSYMTGGFGGTDSQINLFRSTPGEQVIVRTPEQQRRGNDSPTAFHATVINTVDHKAAALAALASPEGAAIVTNVIVQNQQKIRPRMR